jgi:hypothetical protein
VQIDQKKLRRAMVEYYSINIPTDAPPRLRSEHVERLFALQDVPQAIAKSANLPLYPWNNAELVTQYQQGINSHQGDLAKTEALYTKWKNPASVQAGLNSLGHELTRLEKRRTRLMARAGVMAAGALGLLTLAGFTQMFGVGVPKSDIDSPQS